MGGRPCPRPELPASKCQSHTVLSALPSQTESPQARLLSTQRIEQGLTGSSVLYVKSQRVNRTLESNTVVRGPDLPRDVPRPGHPPVPHPPLLNTEELIAPVPPCGHGDGRRSHQQAHGKDTVKVIYPDFPRHLQIQPNFPCIK